VPALTHLPASGRLSVPWKNGGGETQEIAVFPDGAGMDDFQWRISQAVVSAAGAFSVFPGIDRHLTLLSGSLRLDINGVRRDLCPGESVRFAGDVPVRGDPAGTHATDLNIMTRRGAFAAEVAEIAPGGPVTCGAGTCFIFALAPAKVAGQTLAAHDVLRIEDVENTQLHATGGPVLLIRIFRV